MYYVTMLAKDAPNERKFKYRTNCEDLYANATIAEMPE
jgi:hypothetical protein